MSFESRLIAASKTLNYNEKQVIEWIYEHHNELADYSIAKISREVHLSKSFISKLIKKIGFNSFAEFKLMAKEDLCVKAQTVDLTQILDIQLNDINETRRLLSQVDFTSLFNRYSQSEFIYCYGTGHTNQNYIRELSRGLMSIGTKRVIHLSGKSELESILSLVTNKDCFFISSHSGESKDLVDILNKLKLKGVMIVSITSFSNSTLVRLADYNLFYFSTPLFNPVKNNEVSSFLPLNLCIDTLIRNYLVYLQNE